jgi:hypothetical protein
MNQASEKITAHPTPAEELDRVIAEHLPDQDELEFDLGDTLDIKMSIVLVLIVFLAEQSSKFLEISMPLHWHNIQRGAVGVLIVAGILSLWELFPRTYKTRMGHDEFLAWVQQLREFYEHEGVVNPEAKIAEFIRIKDAQRTRERIAANKGLNARKSTALSWSFYFVILAVLLNFATLFGMSLGWRF